VPKGTEREPFLRYDSERLQAALSAAHAQCLREDLENRRAMRQVSDPASSTPDTADSAVTRVSGV
jgi:hypothetical protein